MIQDVCTNKSSSDISPYILDETAYVTASSTELDKAVFMQDETLKQAYVRSLEVIGEAVKQLPDVLRQKYGGIKWRAMAGMRDRLITTTLALITILFGMLWSIACPC